MDKEQFENLTPDQQFSIISTHLNIVKDTTYTRMGLLPFISALFATFLSIATFNGIIPLDNTIKVIISVLILLIPFSLYVYNYDLKKAGEKTRKILENLLGTIEVESTFKDKVIAYLPDILIYILTVISFVIVYKIWGC